MGILIASMGGGVITGLVLGTPEEAARSLGETGGAALVFLGLTWVAIGAWLQELEEDPLKNRFKRVDRLVKLIVPMTSCGAALAVLVTSVAARDDHEAPENLTWAGGLSVVAGLLIAYCVIREVLHRKITSARPPQGRLMPDR